MGRALTRLRFDDGPGILPRMGREMRNLSLVAVLAALLSPAPAMARPAEPLRLAASSKWFVNYATDSCRMAREFGEGDQKVLMVIDQFEPGDEFRFSLFGKPVRTNFNEGDIRVRFGEAGIEQEYPFYPGTADKKTPAIVLRGDVRLVPRSPEEKAAYEAARDAGNYGYPLTRVTPEQEAAVTSIEISRAIRRPILLETGTLGAPFEAMRKCTDELLDHWGIDVAKHAGLTRRATPRTNPAKWMNSSDYPVDMLMLGKRAIVQFRLDVDTTGKPTGCHIQQSTRPKAFDDAVCAAIMRKAKFHPALDADGRPVASYWMTSVNFHI